MEEELSRQLLDRLQARGLVRSRSTESCRADVVILYDRGVPPRADQSLAERTRRLDAFLKSQNVEAKKIIYVAFFSGDIGSPSAKFYYRLAELDVKPFVMGCASQHLNSAHLQDLRYTHSLNDLPFF